MVDLRSIERIFQAEASAIEKHISEYINSVLGPLCHWNLKVERDCHREVFELRLYVSSRGFCRDYFIEMPCDYRISSEADILMLLDKAVVMLVNMASFDIGKVKDSPQYFELHSGLRQQEHCENFDLFSYKRGE